MNKLRRDIYEIIAKDFSKEMSEEECLYLQNWLEESEENQQIYQQLKETWSFATIQNSDEDKLRVLQGLKNRVQTEHSESIPGRKGKNLTLWYRIAASILVIFSLSYLGWGQLSDPFSWYNSIGYLVKECPAGQSKKIQLADGSFVCMNGNSRMKYKESMQEKQRRIYLEGEAFFDVARNEQKPFVVGLKNAEVEVLGTSFNIKAYPEDDLLETSVVTGKVSFTDQRKGILLQPGQKGRIDKKHKTLETLEVDNRLDVAWMEQKLHFENVSLNQIVKDLHRMYACEFKIESKELEKIKITASFDNEQIDEVIKILAMTNEFSFQKEGDVFHLRMK